jgi:arylsulfatase A-like enzyme
VLPYAIVGLLGGLIVTIAVRALLGGAPSPSERIARMVALLTASAVLSYLVVWATYRLGLPLLKASNLIAYLGSAAAATLIGVLMYRVSKRLCSRVERMRSLSSRRLTIGIPVAMGGLIAGALLLPPVYLDRVHSAQVRATGPGTDVAHKNRPNIVFILIDALRADHLPVYGYSRQTAPNLAALARRGVTFTRMYAQAPSTRPSVATILSSLYPTVHKANEDLEYLSGSITVLPEILQAAGYNTFGISANANVSPTFGYAQGFDEFRVWKTESAFRLTLVGRLAEKVLGPRTVGRLLRERGDIVPRADAITDVTLEWISKRGREPFFLYVHYIDPHDPYRPPAPYDRAFDYRADPPRRAGGVDPLSLLANAEDRDRVGRILDQYDGEILYADHQVGRLLERLKTLGVLDNALVMVTADHGEEFFEHGKNIHGKSLYEEVLRVPFLANWPGRIPAGATYDGLAGHIDILPTILALAGLKPPPQIQGTSFGEQLLTPTKRAPDRTFFAQLVSKGFALGSVRRGPYKLILHLRGPQEGLEELYDLEQDPLERQNIALQAPAQVSALRRTLHVFSAVAQEVGSRIPAERAQKLDRDTEQALRSLGYIK